MKKTDRINVIKLITISVLSLLMVFSMGVISNSSASAHQRYYIKNVTWPDQAVIKSYPRYKYPIWHKIGDTSRLSHFQGVTNVSKIATSEDGKRTYAHLVRWGRDLGWVNVRALKQPNKLMLPYVYTSQFWPSKAADACEAASLKMALSVKGKALNVPLATMVSRIPHSNSPYKGYTHNPFKFGTGATIYPAMLSKVARQYGVTAHRIRPSHATINVLRWYVIHGDPVVFEGSHGMRDTNSDHVLTLLGYKPGYFWYADPESRSESNWGSGWVSEQKFMKVFSRRISGKRAMVVKYTWN